MVILDLELLSLPTSGLKCRNDPVSHLPPRELMLRGVRLIRRRQQPLLFCEPHPARAAHFPLAPHPDPITVKRCLVEEVSPNPPANGVPEVS